MSVKIRLARTGANKSPHYRVVVASSTSPRDGLFIEKVGHYHPTLAKGAKGRVVLDAARIEYWLSQGAQPTDTVIRFIEAYGIELPQAIKKKRELAIKSRVAKPKKEKA